ncbi:hypothetical protein [Mycobacterium sp. NPDC050853]|uniref:hypothetical protein n=1 Tax=Mycobacterium sp. NPDC050853 TaxID=3155160 RepID=UPI0033EEF29D
MSAPQCRDSASDIVNVFISALRQGYDPSSRCPPPEVDVVPAVRFFASDGGVPKSWVPFLGCESGPFLWVRVAMRYRARIKDFPAAFTGGQTCADADVKRVLGVEIGVARCTEMEAEPDWDTIAREAEISLDDSWRLETVLCAAAARLRRDGYAVATDTIAPDGPDGGLIAWTGMAYVSF